MATVYVLAKGSDAMPKSEDTIIIWPVEETGKNSVRPSTMARIMALKNDMNLFFLFRGVKYGEDLHDET